MLSSFTATRFRSLLVRTAWATLISGPGCGDDGGASLDTIEAGDEESTGMDDPTPAGCLPGCGPATLEIGDGSAGFQLADRVQLVAGPQGGYHIVLGLRATHIDASGDLATTFTGSIDGTPHGSESPSITLRCNPGTAALETSGILLIWDADVAPEDIGGKTATVDVELTDASGSTLVASQDFIITPL